jgi:hypothetical protein
VLVLFFFFGYRDEARNFSVVFPAIVLIALHGANRFNAIFGEDASASDDARINASPRSDLAVVAEAAR